MVTKTIAITMGDPAGIGPEIIVKALCEDELNGAPLVVVGCLKTLKRLQDKGLAEGVTFRAIAEVAEARFAPGGRSGLPLREAGDGAGDERRRTRHRDRTAE